MAKKARTPPPPRRPVQAPQQRTAPRTPAERRTLLYLLAFSALGILLLGGVLALLAFGGGGSSASGGLIQTTSCTEESFPGLKPRHISNPNANVTYNSFPPSSGPHYQQPAPWGIYPDSVKQTILVHNLEHGGIVIQYGSGVSQSDVQKIQSFYQDDPYGLVVAPYASLKNKIAATAWNEPPYSQNQDANFNQVDPGKGYVLTCTAFDKGALSDFRDKHRNKAGERYASVKDMAPGQ
ncbi:MAG TPA: DUF3105 domain-containing protein [Gaiellaceae bacterium]